MAWTEVQWIAYVRSVDCAPLEESVLRTAAKFLEGKVPTVEQLEGVHPEELLRTEGSPDDFATRALIRRTITSADSDARVKRARISGETGFVTMAGTPPGTPPDLPWGKGSNGSLDRAQTQEAFDSVLEQFAQHRACAVLRTPTREAAPQAMTAAIEGGFKLVEFTLTTPGCLDCVSEFRKTYDGRVMVGCGTIMCVGDAERAVDAGAQFIVMPVFIPEVVQWCAVRHIVCIPGCATPTELYNAHKCGAPLQKVFPGVAGGPMWVKAVSAALPMLRINPTSGVELDNAGDFLNNGAASVGLVAPLFPPDKIAAHDWDAIRANAQKVIANVRKAGPLKR